MIKSSLETRNFDYPVLMKYSLCGEDYVVLMIKYGEGMVVQSNDEKHPIGEYKTNWCIESSGRTFFTLYQDQVILKNQY